MLWGSTLDRLAIKGYVVAEVTKGGVLLARVEGENVVHTPGKNLIAASLIANSGPAPAATQFIQAIAVGSGPATIDELATTLSAEITRAAYTTASALGNVIQYQHAFTNGGVTWNVQEAGLFTALAAGIMVARWLTQGLSVPNAAILTINWSLTIG